MYAIPLTLQRASNLVLHLRRNLTAASPSCPAAHRQALDSLAPASPVAVLYQQVTPPEVGGVRKPKKPSGYSDSGADIAYVLRKNGIPVITPVPDPHPTDDLHWVFADSSEGIHCAIAAGASTLWANTVLFDGHPLQSVAHSSIRVVGQPPHLVQTFDDKWLTNSHLRENQINVASSLLVALDDRHADAVPLHAVSERLLYHHGISMPCVIKPIRGRGSQGVMKVDSIQALRHHASNFLSEHYSLDGALCSKYGDKYIVEQYLDGQEITITVMPPGRYSLGDRVVDKPNYFSLPIVERFNHHYGIAPYSGEKAVITNSRVLSEQRLQEEDCAEIAKACEHAAGLVRARAPIRVDCRSDGDGGFKVFDLNMKPNMTGAGRPGRRDQDSLIMLAARAMGWTYFDLLLNILSQAWRIDSQSI